MIDSFQAESLRIEVSESKDLVVLSWKGESDLRNPRQTLLPYLMSLRDKLRARKVQMRFEELAYMNSATVTPLMEFISCIRTGATEIVIQYRNDLAWQATSFRAMRIVARKWSNVAIQGV
ncbi:MAG: hypothetical protein ABI895_13210 [Deltaproteobacteria bacterium]